MTAKKKRNIISSPSTPKEGNFQEKQHTTAIQNNFNFKTNMDVNGINNLAETSPELANRAMTIYENQLLYSKETDNRILSLEERNKALEESETPYIRQFSFRGQLFAFLISISGIGASIFFGMNSMEWAAVTAITVPLGTLAVQFLGRK